IDPRVAPFEKYLSVVQANPGKTLLFNDVDIMHGLMNGLRSGNDLIRGKRNLGVIAFENTLFDDEAKARGGKYDFIVCHSRFNQDMLHAAGFSDVRLAWQGVDPPEMVTPPRRNRFGDRFVIFSGGKLEFRKAQDVVVEAFRRFHARRPDSVLVTAWHNPWPQFGLDMAESRIAKVPPTIDKASNRLNITQWALANGVPESAFVDLGFLSRAQMTEAMAEVDAAVFPNRCEGATNLVAMEAMGCGIPCVIAANSGQLDLLIEPDVCFPLTRQTQLNNPRGTRTGWCESDPDEIVENLEKIYADRAEAGRRAARGRDFLLRQRTWRQFAEVFVAECDR
ncbi:MAG: glycosyltransferase, partial [Alphaproteobacteria bacterium]